MRKICKYKIYSKTKSIVSLCSNRILKFKRTKWKFLKQLITKNILERKFFINSLSLENKEAFWVRSEKFFSNTLSTKRMFYQLYDSSIRIPSRKLFSKNVTALNFLEKYLIRYEYRLDVLLFKLGYYTTLHESKFYISQKHVKVNDLYIQSNVILKKNDIVYLSKYENHLDSIARNLSISYYLPYVEVDYYTNTFIVTKSINELTIEDLSVMLLLPEGIDRFYDLSLK